ncbi:MAG TPA: hypothetical protein VK930_16030 [Verrucomicrobiae bacterium]|jgi:hypothetical protein|nr:hypothetical protein [Verrucomicrobiae bacterium]
MTAFVSALSAVADGWLEIVDPSCATHSAVAVATINNSPKHLLFIAVISSTDAAEGRFQFYSSGV